MMRSLSTRIGSAGIIVIVAILVVSLTAMLIAKSHTQRIKQHRLAQLQAQAEQLCDIGERLVNSNPALINAEVTEVSWELTPRGSTIERWFVTAKSIDVQQTQITATIDRSERTLVTIKRMISVAQRAAEADPS